jgi:hypothetical protein
MVLAFLCVNEEPVEGFKQSSDMTSLHLNRIQLAVALSSLQEAWGKSMVRSRLVDH